MHELELCGVAKGVDESIDESVLRWFGNIEKCRVIGLLKGCMWKNVCIVA